MILTETAYAKVNLALHVRARMPDGYHALETLFAFTRFGDTLVAERAETLGLTLEGEYSEAAGPDQDNLVLRAARALAPDLGARLHLTKRIPVAAGLGGGSADAAAALRLLNRLWGLNRPIEDLEAIGAMLGADVAACIRSETVRGSGRGELLEFAPPVTDTPILLVNPRVAVPTGPVFKGWDRTDRGPLPEGGTLEAALIGRNDLEAPALAIAPVIADVLAWLQVQPGAGLTRMSGSGATCFALFVDDAAAQAAARAVPNGWWATATQLR